MRAWLREWLGIDLQLAVLSNRCDELTIKCEALQGISVDLAKQISSLRAVIAEQAKAANQQPRQARNWREVQSFVGVDDNGI